MRGKSRQKAERKQTRPASTRPKWEPYRRPRAGIGRGTRIVMSKAHARQPSRERISKCSCLLFVHSRISRIAIDRSIDGRGIPVALCAARKEKSPPAPARMPIYSNERTNERTRYRSPNRASWAVRFHLRTTPHPIPMHASVRLSACLSVRARIVLYGFPFGQRGLKFSIACHPGIRRNCNFRRASLSLKLTRSLLGPSCRLSAGIFTRMLKIL